MTQSLSELYKSAAEVYGPPQEQYSNQDINRYYKHSYLGYKLIHSKSGEMHMKIDGKNNGQIEALVGKINQGARVLEVGCGNGVNIAFLQKEIKASWAGIDLSSSSISRAEKKCSSQTDFRVGSFENMPFENNSFDYIFAVETLCHASDRNKALSELDRVLAPGGTLFIWDGWRKDDLSEESARAASLAERAMAVNNGATRKDWIKSAKGFKEVAWQDCSEQIMDNTKDFHEKALFFVKNKKARIILRALPRDLRANGVAALLIHPLLSQGVWEYGLFELKSN